MTKIKQINFKDYRAFWGDDNLIIVDSKNVLIYGENGSGKSSLYQGLKDFFKAVDATWENEQHPGHLKAENINEYEVSVIFSDDADNPVIYGGRTIENKAISQTYLLNSFLSYREMLKTHFLEQYEFNEKFFELITQTLLVEHEIGDTTIGKALEDLENSLANPTDREALLKKAREKDPDFDEADLDIFDPKTKIEEFKTLFNELLQEINNPLNEILNYFNQGLTVKFGELELTFDEDEKKLKCSIGLDVNYIEEENINHLEILNEARLSALAISIYLAALVTNPVVSKVEYKILFLDDIFIGLDTTNRLPLLKILKDFKVDEVIVNEKGEIVKNENDEPQTKKVKFFKNFQIFITTYDRYWFEIAKKNLGDSWTTVEMFAGEVKDSEERKICDKPVIQQERLGNLEKARKYFEAFDYFSSGNWLRKALEEELEQLIPETHRIEVKTLETLIDKLFIYYSDCSCSDLIPAEFKIELKTFKDSVLNPSSHFDLQNLIYKSEIEETFLVLDKLKELPKIERELLIGMRSAIFYRNDEKNYTAEYILRENICAIKIEGNPTRISDANHSTVSWQLDGIDFSKKDRTVFEKKEVINIKSKVIKLSEKPAKIMNFLDLLKPPDWKNFTNIEGKTLQQLADEIAIVEGREG